MTSQIEPFHLAIPEEDLSDLRYRIDRTRWPDKETVEDWSQGAPLAKVKALVEYWGTAYDWRRCEAMLNELGQFHTRIDGVSVHFLHVRSPHEDALPIILTHGWPGSVIEFYKVIGPLTRPDEYGGKAADAFHVVAPSLPGFGFSDKPTQASWTVPRIARAWSELMRRLGYERFVAQGGDWGAGVTTALGFQRRAELAAIHLNFPLVCPDVLPHHSLTVEEQEASSALNAYVTHESGYAKQHATRPQTVGYGLTDSPAALAAWIYEKFHNWTDCDGDPESVLTLDDMLDNISIYWLTGTGTSSGRTYWHNAGAVAGGFAGPVLDIPVGCSIFPREIYRAPRRWAERKYKNLIYWNEPVRGGHFAAFEQPAIFADELRNCFRSMRAN